MAASTSSGSRSIVQLAPDQEALDLIHPILKFREINFMQSAREREKVAQASGESFSAPNRQRVLHGESCDYGTEINSLKVFSFLTFVGLHLPMVVDSPLREFKKINTP